MKKIIVCMAATVFYFHILAAGNLVENRDKPLKGQWDFNPRQVWAVAEAGEDIPVRVGSIQVDDDGKIFVFEVKMTKILVFAPDGKFLFSFGRRGEGPGEFKTAFNLFLFKDRLIVPDSGRLHIFSKTGAFTRSVFAGSMIFPRAFIDENRFVHLKEPLVDKPSGSSLEIFDLEKKENNTILTLPAEENVTASSGGMVVMIKDSKTQPGIVLDYGDNHLFFGRSDKYLVRKTDLAGKEIFAFTLDGRKRKKISQEYKRKRFENVMVNNARMPETMIDQMVKSIPDEAPFFNRIMVEKSGLIYIFVSDPVKESGQEIDIFSPTGKYLYHAEIKAPNHYTIKSGLTFKNNELYLFTEDEEGEGKLLKFTINMPQN
jgi:hypothetical protein